MSWFCASTHHVCITLLRGVATAPVQKFATESGACNKLVVPGKSAMLCLLTLQAARLNVTKRKASETGGPVGDSTAAAADDPSPPKRIKATTTPAAEQVHPAVYPSSCAPCDGKLCLDLLWCPVMRVTLASRGHSILAVLCMHLLQLNVLLLQNLGLTQSIHCWHM